MCASWTARTARPAPAIPPPRSQRNCIPCPRRPRATRLVRNYKSHPALAQTCQKFSAMFYVHLSRSARAAETAAQAEPPQRNARRRRGVAGSSLALYIASVAVAPDASHSSCISGFAGLLSAAPSAHRATGRATPTPSQPPRSSQRPAKRPTQAVSPRPVRLRDDRSLMHARVEEQTRAMVGVSGWTWASDAADDGIA